MSTCFLAILACCNDNAIDYTSNDNANVQSEINSDALTEESDDLANVAISSDAATINGREDTGGREEITVSDDRFSCATVTLDRATANNPPANSILYPHGFITVDFGSGCAGPGGRTRSGKIVFEYLGRRYGPASKIVTTFQNYTINGIIVSGTRTLSNTAVADATVVSYTIIEDAKITYPDGTFATRSSTTIRSWNKTTSPTGDVWTVTGSSAGVNRKGKQYIMTITKDLVYKRSCGITNKVFMPVQGIKDLKVDGKAVTIDFGDGTCNTKVTISILGKSKTVEPTADGS